MFDTVLKSTKAKVSNVQAVQEILDTYWFNFEPEIEPERAESGSLIILECHSWPEAVNIDEWPDEEEYPDDDTWFDAMYDLLHEKGDEGFVDMLRELAPYLEEPLDIVWHSIDEGFFVGAGHWTVWPRSPHVQVQKVLPLANN